MQTLSVVEARSRFSELLSRAAAGERFLIQRRERDVAVLLGAEELAQLEEREQIVFQLARALGQDEELLHEVDAKEAHPAMAAFGLWRNDEELANLAEAIVQDRRQEDTRAEVAFEDPG